MNQQKQTRHQVKWLLWSAILSCFIFLSPSAAPGFSANEKEIIVGGDHKYQPYEYLNKRGLPAGFNIDLIREIGDVMGLQVTFQLGPWSQVRKAFEKGKIDVLPMFYSIEREQVFCFSKPYTILHHKIFVRRGGPAIHSLDEMRGREVILQHSGFAHDYLQKHDVGAQLVLVESEADAIRLLASGAHDCALITQIGGRFMIRQYNLSNLRVLGPALLPCDYCLAVKEGNTELLDQLNKGLAILKATGRYDELQNKWFGGLLPGGFPFLTVLRYTAWILGPLLLILAGVLAWTWTLRKQISQRTKELQIELSERKRQEAINNVLFNISKATTETSSLDDLLAEIHKQVGTLMDANNFFVCLAYDTKKNLYTFPYYKDINPKDIVEPDEIFEITEGLTHHVLKTKEYLLGNKEELKKIGVIGTVPESWLGIPLKTEAGDVNGVVAVQSYEKEAYSEKDAQVLSIMANNIMGALKYKKAEEYIKASLQEKEVLLQEVHHRVKNNMQLISSLFSLQSRHIKDKQAYEIFKSSQNRVRSMAIIHERLYQSKDFERVDFAEYVQSLTGHLLSSYGINPDVIKLYIDIKDIFLDINTAIPCSLFINELVSNSLKHAFPGGKKGEIKIAAHPLNKNEIELVVSDNGVGIPEKVDFRKTESLGLHLVTILVEDQLHGDIKLDRTKGTTFHIIFRTKR